MGSLRDFSLIICCEYQFNLLEVKLKNKCAPPPVTGFNPVIFISHTFYTGPHAILQLRFRFSYPSTGSQGVSALGFYTVELWFSGFTCLSNFGCLHFSCDLTSLMELRGVVGFSICSVFYLLGGSDYFQAPQMSNLKPEVLLIFLVLWFLYWRLNIEDFLSLSFLSILQSWKKKQF